jgi:hypothetical protein
LGLASSRFSGAGIRKNFVRTINCNHSHDGEHESRNSGNPSVCGHDAVMDEKEKKEKKMRNEFRMKDIKLFHYQERAYGVELILQCLEP